MESEKVTIRLSQRSFTVDALFHFYNTGDSVTDWVGFPKRVDVKLFAYAAPTDFVRFDTWVDGRKTKIVEEFNTHMSDGIAEKVMSALSRFGIGGGTRTGPSDPKTWLAQQVTFRGHDRTIIRVCYESQYAGYPDNTEMSRAAYYIIDTGSYWKDRIGKAVFIVDSSGVGGTANIALGSRDFEMVAGPIAIGESLLMLEMSQLKPPPQAMLTIYVRGPMAVQERAH